MTTTPAKLEPRCDSATPGMTVARMRELISVPPNSPWPDGWAAWENTRGAHVSLLDELIETTPDYPEGKWSGRGIVISVNAKPGWSSGKLLQHGYFPGAWVTVKELRRLGCTLPIAFTHMGLLEWDANLTRIMEPLGVQVIDLEECEKTDPMRVMGGWESKIYGVWQAPFEEVLYLDADNIPLIDPTFLFDCQQYTYYGSIFWPDVPPMDRADWLPKEVWENIGMPHQPHVRAAESGQMVINKREWWREMVVCRWINEHSDYYYRVIFGDKDAPILASEKLYYNQMRKDGCGLLRYFMPERGPGGNHASLTQFTPDSRRPLFQHGTRNKPTIHGYPAPDALLARKECEAHLAELRRVWHGKLWWNEEMTPEERSIVAGMQGRRYRYERYKPDGSVMDGRTVRFLEDRRIGRGAAKCEFTWNLFVDAKGPALMVSDIDGAPTFHARLQADGSWRGRWLAHERCPCSLTLEG